MKKTAPKKAPPRNKNIKKAALVLFAINFIICGFFVFEQNMNCSYKVDMTSQLQVAWREAHCPETLVSPDAENMVLKQNAEDAEKPANISP